MVAYVIVPGIGGSDAQHWQSLWEQEWALSAARIAPTSWTRPTVADWVQSLERTVDQAAARHGDVVLIAHSLGCWAAAAWLGETDQQVESAFLVAPPDRDGEMFPASAAPSFLNIPAQTLPCTSMVVASTNDPYGTVQHAEELARTWGSTLNVVGPLGHISTASRLGSWHQGQRLLSALANL
ncbi:RBBP9/YdeN family alpha/beta hydrolase [Microbacterium sp. NPDC056052]|uniref:RBBP9/YdeN family alpha/beta hydrolase n=1 Tax=Microbacterium sp. NPDC056052 TaxID=3345695 RepID=UPI0035DE9205